MPTTEELRKEWRHGDKNGGGDKLAIRFLGGAGYQLNKDWTWTLPTADHSPTAREISAMEYLISEWDFGGIRK